MLKTTSELSLVPLFYRRGFISGEASVLSMENVAPFASAFFDNVVGFFTKPTFVAYL